MYRIILFIRLDLVSRYGVKSERTLFGGGKGLCRGELFLLPCSSSGRRCVLALGFVGACACACVILTPVYRWREKPTAASDIFLVSFACLSVSPSRCVCAVCCVCVCVCIFVCVRVLSLSLFLVILVSCLSGFPPRTGTETDRHEHKTNTHMDTQAKISTR